MKDDNMSYFNELEIDSLQEIMNISFGSAAADLADIIDIFIKLNVPDVKIIKVPELTSFIKNEIKDFDTCSIVEQNYHGDFNGIAFLIFPYGNEKELISYFQGFDINRLQSDEMIELEKEVLMEVGNILIGACIGKIFEILESKVTYLPPRTLIMESFEDFLLKGHFSENDIAITLKTHFTFEDRRVAGYMFLVNSQESIPHLKDAVLKFTGRNI